MSHAQHQSAIRLGVVKHRQRAPGGIGQEVIAINLLGITGLGAGVGIEGVKALGRVSRNR